MKLKVELTCKLCNETKKLSNSHIIPEFFFEPIYGNKKKKQAIETIIEPFKERPFPIGWRDPLLCKNCETKISKFENYVKDIWYNKKWFPFHSKNDTIVLSDLNYNKFKLFHLSVLWRASISKLEQFRHVKLSHHQDIIKNMLINEVAGDDSIYPFYAVAFTLNGRVHDRLILNPIVRNFKDHQLFVFVFGGCVWHYIVSNLQIEKYSEQQFKKDGKLYLKKYEWHEIPFIRDIQAARYEKIIRQS